MLFRRCHPCHPRWCDDRGVSIASVAGENWAGSHVFTAPALVEATTVAEVQDAVAAAATSGGRVRALGTRHSFTDLADTTGTLVSVTGVDPDPVLDVTARTVTVGGGVRYGVLAPWLEDRAGRCTTWARCRTSPSRVRSPRAPTARAWAIACSPARSRRSSTWIIAANSSRCAEAIPTSRVSSSGSARSASSCGSPSTSSRAIGCGRTSTGTSRGRRCSTSSRPCWGSATASASSTTGRVDAVDQVWVKSRLDRLDGEMPDTWLGAERDPRSEGRLIDLASENLTVQGGVEGAWLDRLPHFRLESTPSIGAELQTEYFVERSDGPRALRGREAARRPDHAAAAGDRAAHGRGRRPLAESRVRPGRSRDPLHLEEASG